MVKTYLSYLGIYYRMVAERGTSTADIVAESLLDWGVDTIFGLPGDGINGFIDALGAAGIR